MAQGLFEREELHCPSTPCLLAILIEVAVIELDGTQVQDGGEHVVQALDFIVFEAGPHEGVLEFGIAGEKRLGQLAFLVEQVREVL